MTRIIQQLLFLSCFFFFACGNSIQKDESKAKEMSNFATASSNKKSSDSIATTMNFSNNNEQKKNSIVTDNDGDWSQQNVVLTNTKEAEWMIRTGDIDNLGFGRDEGFTPFSGKSTSSHGFPWDAKNEDAPGTDRIMVPSSYKSGSSKNGSDGYSGTKRPDNDPRPISLLLTSIKTADIKSASLQMFVDDFQSPVFSSRFQVKINGERFIEMERMLNALEQTGPIGKIINIKLPDEFLPMLKNDSLSIFIDDPVTG